MKFRKKPVVIEAIQWTGTEKSTKQIYVLMGVDGEKLLHSLSVDQGKFTEHVESLNKHGFIIETLEGFMKANVGDYIIKGIQGEFYPCKPDIFLATYEVVE